MRPVPGHRSRFRRALARPGAAAVELALVLPLLMFLFVIAADYGRVFYFALTVENCARNGALYASDPAAARSPYSSVEQAALADASDLVPPPTVSSTGGVDGAGNAYVEVTVTWQFQTIVDYPGVPGSTALVRTVRMRVAPVAPN